MPMPFPLDVFTARPAGGATVPDRRGSLDGGFGNRALAAPMQEPGAPEGTPTRYLGRQTYGLSPGPNQSPAVPSNQASMPQPNDNGPLTLMEAYLEYRRRLEASQLPASAFEPSAPAVPRNPSSIAPAPDDDGPLTLMEAYQQYRKRIDASQPQSPAAAADADDSNFSGGLVGRLTALMRQYPGIYGPPPEDDESSPYYRWMGNR
jgi:hypothetical protein